MYSHSFVSVAQRTERQPLSLEISVWKIQKIVSKGEYNYAVVPNHPHATQYGYVLEHRVVMESHLGRLLSSDEVVHHKNGNKKDNRVENLELLSGSQHSQLHASEIGKTLVQLKCPNCKSIFEIRKGNSFLQKGGRYTCCSRNCNGALSRKIQLGRTAEVEQAISENLVRIFKRFPDNSEVTLS